MAAALRKRWAAVRKPRRRRRRQRRQGRQEEAPPESRGACADYRCDEEAVGGAEEGQSGAEISRAEESDDGGGQTGPKARPDKPGQEIKVGGRAEEGDWPDEGRTEAAGGAA
jgi:hypothetical protein